jgi:hypothetical protein
MLMLGFPSGLITGSRSIETAKGRTRRKEKMRK